MTDGSWFTHTSADGTAIECCAWLPDGPPRAVLLISHGAAEHAARYGRLAGLLNERGFAVYAPDQRGHGRTAANIDSLGVARPGGWDAMVADLVELADETSARHAGIPLLLLGHSMGSVLSRLVMAAAGDRFAAFVLSGITESAPPDPGMAELLAGVEAAEGADGPSALFAGMFGGFNEEFADGVEEPTGYEWLSRDAAEVRLYVDDPWCGMDLSNGFVSDMLGGMGQLADPAALASVPAGRPILIFAGDQDPVGGHGAAVPALAADYEAAGLGPVTTHLYAGGRHEMLNETNRDEVHADLLSWFDEVLGGA